MVTSTGLSALQYEQQQHDEIAHRDILALPLDRRLTHMVLHFAKYSGRLFRDEMQEREKLERVIVDTAVICLASANALGIRLADRTSEYSKGGRHGWGARPLHDRDVGSIARWLGMGLALETAEMAKACESLDHLEDFPFRRTIECGVVEIAGLAVAAANAAQINVVERVRQRWAGIEGKYSRTQKEARSHDPLILRA